MNYCQPHLIVLKVSEQGSEEGSAVHLVGPEQGVEVGQQSCRGGARLQVSTRLNLQGTTARYTHTGYHSGGL